MKVRNEIVPLCLLYSAETLTHCLKVSRVDYVFGVALFFVMLYKMVCDTVYDCYDIVYEFFVVAIKLVSGSSLLLHYHKAFFEGSPLTAMYSFAELPFELRCNICSYLLKDDNTYYPPAGKSIVSWWMYDKPTSRPPQPVFCTSLFTVNKQVSAETLEYFYTQNLFVAVEDVIADSCLKDYFLFITLPHLPNETATTPQIPSQNLALTVRMEGAEKIDKQFTTHGFRKKIVFSGRYLGLFLVLMSHDSKWTGITEPVEGIGITFTFNLQRGEYNFSLVPRNIDTIVDAIAMLRDFPKSANLIGGVAYCVVGDILDENQKLAKELLDGFLSPYDRQVMYRDINFILREANARRDLGQLPQTVPVLYEGAENLLSRLVTYNPSHVSMDPEPCSLRSSEMLEIQLATQAGGFYQELCDFVHAARAFQRAIFKYKNLQYSTPSDNYLTVLYRMCGQAFMEQFNAARKGMGGHYSSPTDNISNVEDLLKCSLEDALLNFVLAYQQSPDQGVMQEMRECSKIISEMGFTLKTTD